MKKLFVVILTLALAVALALLMAAPAMAATDPGLVALWRFDGAGNAIAASTSNDNTVTYDITLPTVTINQAAWQDDPTTDHYLDFEVVFSEPVTGFDSGDVILSGTAGATTVTVSQRINYTVTVSGMTQAGTVTASIAAGGAYDTAGNGNTASTSTDNTVTYITHVTINQASGQADPTSTSPINFKVVFSVPVTDFATGDVTLDGTAGATTAVVTGSGTTYNVAVSGMQASGTVIPSIAAGKAHDAYGNGNIASTSTDNSITYNAPLIINQAAGQADPTNTSPINFTVVFSKPVTDFATGDVTVSGTAGAITAVVTGSGANYNVAISGMTSSGTVIASIAEGAAHDGAGNAIAASTSNDNTVTYDITLPTVTINQAAGQADPTGASPINFTVVFSEPVTGFYSGDVILSGTAGATTVTVRNYTVIVSGMTRPGTVTVSIAAGGAHDAAGNGNTASTSTDNTVNYNIEPLNVTINQATWQEDPTTDHYLYFQVVFSELVTDFATGDVTLDGTAGATTAKVVMGSGANYNVMVSGMTSNGTVIARIDGGKAHDAAGNANIASTSTDNIVTYDATLPTITINQATGQSDPTGTSPINFTVVFSEPVTDFATGDVTVSGTAGAITAVVAGSGTTYNVAVSGMTSNGTVIVSIDAGKAHDAAGNANIASTSTDNTVTYNNTYSINGSAGSGGSITPSGNVTVNSGDNQIFTIAASPGYHIADVKVDGATVGAVATYTFSNVTAGHTIAASFAINTYTLTYTACANGSISGTASQTVSYGGSGTAVTAQPNTGYHFVSWSDGSTANPRTDSNVTGDISVNASFAINTYTLTYTAGANGSITGTSPQTVNYGTSGTQVTAVPNTVYHFVQWSDGVTTAARTDNNVTANINVTANFAINTFTIAPSAGPGGSVTPSGNVTVNYGDNVTFAIAASPGYHIADVQVDGATVGAVATYTFSNVTAGHTIAASFASNYGFNGLLPPYVAPPKTFKIGSSIPLKWQYTNSAGTVVDSAAANPTVDINRVGDGGSAETPITLDDPGSSGLRYDSLTMTWQFNWKTKDLAAGIYNIRVVSGQTGLNGPFLIQLR